MELLLENVDEFALKIFSPTNNNQTSNSIRLPGGGVSINNNNALKLMTSSLRDVSLLATTPAPPMTMTSVLPDSDWLVLNETLREDFRYRHMNKLHQVRENMMKQVKYFLFFLLQIYLIFIFRKIRIFYWNRNF